MVENVEWEGKSSFWLRVVARGIYLPNFLLS